MTVHDWIETLKERLSKISPVQRVKSGETTSIAEILAADGRPPVVYLRSFGADFRGDSYLSPRLAGMLLTARPTRALSTHVDNLKLRGLARKLISGAKKAVHAFIVYEDTMAKVGGLLNIVNNVSQVDAALTKAFSDIGPVVAIGRPGEHYAPRGPSRVYVEDNNWQDEIVAWLKIASVIIIRPDVSSGVMWELQTAMSSCDPRRVCIVFWGTERSRYSEIRDCFASVVEFPAYSELERGFLGYTAGIDRLTLFHYGVIDDGTAKLRPLSLKRGPRSLIVKSVDLSPVTNEMRQRCESLPPPALYAD